MGACHEGCSATLLQPLSHQGHLLWLGGRWSPLEWLRLEAGLGWEWRRDLEDRRLRLQPPASPALIAGRGRHLEQRGSSSVTATARLSPRFSLALRHEWLGGRPRSSRVADPPDASWDKQVVLLGAAWAW